MSDQTVSPFVRALAVVVGRVFELVEQFDLALMPLGDPSGPLTLDDPAWRHPDLQRGVGIS